MTIFEIIGLIGVLFYVLGYALLQTNKINNFYYTLTNLFGASFVMVSLFEKWNLPSFIIQAVWILISLYGIFCFLKNKKKAKE